MHLAKHSHILLFLAGSEKAGGYRATAPPLIHSRGGWGVEPQPLLSTPGRPLGAARSGGRSAGSGGYQYSGTAALAGHPLPPQPPLRNGLWLPPGRGISWFGLRFFCLLVWDMTFELLRRVEEFMKQLWVGGR